MHLNVVFDNITSTHIRQCFIQAHQKFEELHQNKIILAKRSLDKTNMQAQPVINWSFWNKEKRAYQITLSNHIELEQYFRPEILPEEILIGWFAHELGHLMDYRARSGWEMITFALKYLFSNDHRVKTERLADVYAIEKGFSDYLVATKKFILEHADLPDKYKERIKKYYLSIEEVEELRLDKVI